MHPGRAQYTVNNTYRNNVHSRNVIRVPIGPLINLALTTHDSTVNVPGFLLNGTYAYGTAPANWSTAVLEIYRDNNMMTIFNALMSWLDGEFLASLTPADTTNDPGNSNITYLMQWEEGVTTSINGVSTSEGRELKPRCLVWSFRLLTPSSPKQTVSDSTRFNSIFGRYSASTAAFLSFNISADVLNDYLFNTTHPS